MQDYYFGEEEYTARNERRQSPSVRQAAPIRRPAPTGSSSARRRKKKKKLSSLMVTAVMLLIGAIALGAYFFFFANKEKTVSMTETPIAQGMTKLNTGSGMLFQSFGQSESGTESYLSYYDWSKSKRNYSYLIKSSNLRMNGSSGISVVYDENKLNIIGMIENDISFNGEILTVECGTDHIGLLRKDSAGGESILILSRTGEQIDQLLADGQYIVSFGFYSTTSEMMWMETLSVTAGTPITTITTYDLSKRMSTGVMEIHDQLVDSLYFTSNSIFVVGTNQIIRYTMESKEVYKEMIYGYKVIDFSSASGTPTFLMAPREGNMNSIQIMTLAENDSSSAASTYLQLPGEGLAGNIMNGSLIVVTEDYVYTYTLKGKLSATAHLELPVTEAIKITDAKMLMAHEGTYYVAKVR